MLFVVSIVNSVSASIEVQRRLLRLFSTLKNFVPPQPLYVLADPSLLINDMFSICDENQTFKLIPSCTLE